MVASGTVEVVLRYFPNTDTDADRCTRSSLMQSKSIHNVTYLFRIICCVVWGYNYRRIKVNVVAGVKGGASLNYFTGLLLGIYLVFILTQYCIIIYLLIMILMVLL